jgi:hypothetical protein
MFEMLSVIESETALPSGRIVPKLRVSVDEPGKRLLVATLAAAVADSLDIRIGSLMFTMAVAAGERVGRWALSQPLGHHGRPCGRHSAVRPSLADFLQRLGW